MRYWGIGGALFIVGIVQLTTQQCATNQYEDASTTCQSCTGVANSQNTGNGLICDCSDAYYWNFDNYACQRCSQSSDQYVLLYGNHNGGQCACKSMAIWNPSTSNCDLDCTLVENSQGVGDGEGGCECAEEYAWSSFAKICRKIKNKGSDDPPSVIAISIGASVAFLVLCMTGLIIHLCINTKLFTRRKVIPRNSVDVDLSTFKL